MRRALIVGIDRYEAGHNLTGAVRDARAIEERLSRHGGTSRKNWHVGWWRAADRSNVEWVEGALTDDTDGEAKAAGRFAKGQVLRTAVSAHFTRAKPDDDLLLYFAGHAVEQRWGSELLASDLQGFSFQNLLWLVDQSRARSVTIILDCCVAGSIGNSSAIGRELFQVPRADLREGLTILTSSRQSEESLEGHDGGVFSRLLISGLDGAAADITGKITALNLYAHASEAFDKNAQRPLIKAHAAEPVTLRTVNPKVTAERLSMLSVLFPDPNKPFRLTMEHEGIGRDGKGSDGKRRKYVAFKTGTKEQQELDHLKVWRDRGLVRSVTGEDFYFLCLADGGGYVELTEFGRYLRDLAAAGAFGRA